MENEDAELVTEYLSGEDAALSQLINRHVGAVYNFAFRLTNDAAAAEDIAQETFIKTWKHLKRFDKKKSFRNWILAITRNTAIDHLRKKRVFLFSFFSRAQSDEEAFSFEETLKDAEPTPEEIAVLREQTELLQKHLAELFLPYREVLYLHYNEGLTFEEIGIILKKPLNTVKSHHRRALMMLRKLMSEDASME